MLRINFDKPLKVPTRYKHPANETLSDDSVEQWIQLSISSVNYEDGQSEIEIESYTLIRFIDSIIDIEVEFKYPKMLSINIVDPEYIVVTFNQQLISVDHHILQDNTVLVDIIPQQYDQSELDSLKVFKDQVTAPIIYITVSQLVLNLFVGAGLKYMWKVINVLQFIVFYQIWQINFPPKASIFVETLKNLAFFEFLQEWAKQMLEQKAEECNSSDDYFCRTFQLKTGDERLGLRNFLENAGVMVLGAVILGVAVISTVVLLTLSFASKSVKILYLKVKQAIFWNSFIRYLF